MIAPVTYEREGLYQAQADYGVPGVPPVEASFELQVAEELSAAGLAALAALIMLVAASGWAVFRRFAAPLHNRDQ